MKLYDINGVFKSIDVRESSYPIKSKSKSSLQGKTANFLKENFPRLAILEEFTIPGSRMSVDFFLPQKRMVIEVQGIQHDQFSPHFHGDRNTSLKYAGQISRDRSKRNWAEINDLTWIEIRLEEELQSIINE